MNGPPARQGRRRRAVGAAVRSSDGRSPGTLPATPLTRLCRRSWRARPASHQLRTGPAGRGPTPAKQAVSGRGGGRSSGKRRRRPAVAGSGGPYSALRARHRLLRSQALCRSCPAYAGEGGGRVGASRGPHHRATAACAPVHAPTTVTARAEGAGQRRAACCSTFERNFLGGLSCCSADRVKYRMWTSAKRKNHASRWEKAVYGGRALIAATSPPPHAAVQARPSPVVLLPSCLSTLPSTFAYHIVDVVTDSHTLAFHNAPAVARVGSWLLAGAAGVHANCAPHVLQPDRGYLAPSVCRSACRC